VKWFEEQSMKVNDPNLGSLGSAGGSTGIAGSAGTRGATAPARTGASGLGAGGTSAAGNDDVHLSELVRSLRSMAAESPERQAKIEALTRAYASGSYQVDSQATASAIIGDATKG
jgi:flagellar biosynthesis anti-sigma factor FlgM